jgi:hypothetical protein
MPACLGRHRHHGESPPRSSGTTPFASRSWRTFLRIGFVLVDLVDGDHQRHFGRLGMRDRFDGLRHGAVVGGHYQHHDVCHLGATRAHGGESFVAGVSRKVMTPRAVSTW